MPRSTIGRLTVDTENLTQSNECEEQKGGWNYQLNTPAQDSSWMVFFRVEFTPFQNLKSIHYWCASI
jgi:hypothetical protein